MLIIVDTLHSLVPILCPDEHLLKDHLDSLPEARDLDTHTIRICLVVLPPFLGAGRQLPRHEECHPRS